MPRQALTPDVALDVLLSAICARHRFDADPTACLAELRAAAGKRHDLLARQAGSWAGYYRDEHTARLCDALLAIPGAVEHVDDDRRPAGIPGRAG